jgi:hypothetical protein
VIATVPKRDERPRLVIVPLVRPVDLQTVGIGMQPRQLPEHGAHERAVIQAFDIDHLRGWCG